jgi:hypothetical protein
MGNCIANKKEPSLPIKTKGAKKEKAATKLNKLDYSITNIVNSTVVKQGK